MQSVFVALYGIHPVLPAVWLAVLGLGVLALPIYCAIQRLPYSIGAIWGKAQDGWTGARLVIAPWLASAVAGVFAIAAMVLR